MEKQQETERELHLDELQEVAGGDNQTGAIVGSTLGGAALVGGSIAATGIYASRKLTPIAKDMSLTGAALAHISQTSASLADISRASAELAHRG
jgi:hypothetical protein